MLLTKIFPVLQSFQTNSLTVTIPSTPQSLLFLERTAKNSFLVFTCSHYLSTGSGPNSEHCSL